jgi:D-hexose-6-phosphate mutarotase
MPTAGFPTSAPDTGAVEEAAGSGGLPLWRATALGETVEIYRQGAQVASFRPADGREKIWMSPQSPFAAGKPIRGGIPVCWPQFGLPEGGTLPQHGFARTRDWKLEETARLGDGRLRLVLALGDDAASRALWPYRFRLELAVTVGAGLELALTTTNCGSDPFRYEDCLHSYFAVGDVGRAEVEGLDGQVYFEKSRGPHAQRQTGTVVPAGEIDRLYPAAAGPFVLAARASGGRLEVAQDGFAGAVVWNAGGDLGPRHPELGPAWSEYLCLEAVNARSAAICLLPGTSHRSAVAYRFGPLAPSAAL